jgi:uncharacterized protein (DUF486 family)
VWTIVLLILSNAFMTIAWYGHLRFRNVPIYFVIPLSWLIALPEYALQVPANRIGSYTFTPTQLKVIQEVISLTVFAIFSFYYFEEVPTWRTVLAFVLIVVAVFLVRTSKTQPVYRQIDEPASVPAAPPDGAAPQ